MPTMDPRYDRLGGAVPSKPITGIGGVCGGLGAKPPNADAPAIFFLLIYANVLFSIFGAKP